MRRVTELGDSFLSESLKLWFSQAGLVEVEDAAVLLQGLETLRILISSLII